LCVAAVGGWGFPNPQPSRRFGATCPNRDSVTTSTQKQETSLSSAGHVIGRAAWCRSPKGYEDASPDDKGTRYSTASTCCVPACLPTLSMPTIQCAPTKASPVSNAPFAASRPQTSIFIRSSTRSARACAPTCPCACSPIISNDMCAKRWRPCCSTITIALLAKPCARRRWPRQNLRRPPRARPGKSAQMMANRFTASGHCSPTSPRSHVYGWRSARFALAGQSHEAHGIGHAEAKC
jgi:hypothetical protein